MVVHATVHPSDGGQNDWNRRCAGNYRNEKILLVFM